MKFSYALFLVLIISTRSLYAMDQAAEHALVAYLALTLKQDYSKAISEYSAAIQLQPDNHQYYFDRSKVYLNTLDYPPALEDLNKAIALKDDSYEYYLKRASVYLTITEPQNALTDINEALRLLSYKIDLRLSQQEVLTQQQEFKKVYDIYMSSDASSQMPIDRYIVDTMRLEKTNYENTSNTYTYNIRYLETLLLRALTYESLTHYDKALLDYDKVIHYLPDNLTAYALRSALYERTEQYHKALEDIDRLVALAPDNSELYLQRGRMYGHLGQQDQEIKDLSNAIEKDPTQPNSYWLRGLNYYSLKRYDDAIADFSHMLTLVPAHTQSLYMRACAYCHLKKHEAALDDFTQLLEQNPSHLEARINRALLYNTMRDSRAIADLEYLLDVVDSTKQVDILHELGIAYMYVNKHDKAIEQFKKALLITPDNARIYSTYGLCYYRIPDYESALEALDIAIDLSPDVPTPYFYRAFVYREQKNYREALQNLEYIIHMDSAECYKAYLHKGIIYEKIDDPDNARTSYQECIDSPCPNKDEDDINFAKKRITDIQSKMHKPTIKKHMNTYAEN